MIAFMDDTTRFIVGWELLADKTAATCARFVARILNATRLRPCVLGSDNGEEFKGDIFAKFTETAGHSHLVHSATHTTAEWKNRALLADYGTHDRRYV
jgi:hypothetical protein